MPQVDLVARAEWNRQYRKRPEVKARDRENYRSRYLRNPEMRAKNAAYGKKRRSDPAHRVWKSEYQRQRRVAQWARTRLAELRVKARKNGVPFDLVEDDLLLPERCPVFGTLMVLAPGRQNDQTPSVDRIVPSVGYVRGNIVIVSLRANRLKNDATPAEMRLLAVFYSNLEKSK